MLLYSELLIKNTVSLLTEKKLQRKKWKYRGNSIKRSKEQHKSNFSQRLVITSEIFVEVVLQWFCQSSYDFHI